jgi:UDP-N-acetylmuramyl tripeptide synthase
VSLGWFGLDPHGPLLARATAGQPLATVEDGWMILRRGEEAHRLVAVDAMPLSLHGSARHNVANALAASVAAWTLGCAVDEIRQALASFGERNTDNPGRANLFELDGVRILLDYAHNPHGIEALAHIARSMSGGRRILVIGQAGNRDDDAIRGLAQSAWSMGLDHVVLKEMEAYRRGRPLGEIPGLLAAEFQRLGLPATAIEFADSEVAAVEHALRWARPGDLLILTVHSSRAQVLDLLASRGAREHRTAMTAASA